ncbi:DUF4224 domain-containing protein [Stenotrophomonas rhizophila]|nr:DUF4224 domain-containing protein [Stenotrophomonas rhizophila]MCC7635599.1 DUF4224 domain-containing protein [Stenotrophomonas rhizophila]MCC7665246.1 DUF4224 domain-containing protein [Stenotrophomonas rhizophila]
MISEKRCSRRKVGGGGASRAEVEEISRTPIRARQLAFLCRNGIPHHVDEYNRVIVLRKAVGASVTPDSPRMAWRSNKAV